jgi:serine/threonine-protein kinase HipA
MNNKETRVSIDLDNQTIQIGRLWCHSKNNRESASFEYDQNWLQHPARFALEPALQLTPGSFHTPTGFRLFGAIGDSAPDRWGRLLMRRAASLRAKENNQTTPSLSELDYLLGVNDEARQGALRFSLPNKPTTFLAEKNRQSIPPLIDLPKLLSATEHVIEKNETAESLRLLLAPGSSLGGARPKASIRDKDGSLAIAKFPSKEDEYNTVLWEATALSLAKQAGIKTADWRVETVCDKPVLILRRFDRHNVRRIPFLSAMSMIGAKDNEQHSYLELAYALIQQGSQPLADLEELWRRIVFTIMISNTDDHLRNHGFLYINNAGWQLSPAYDLNPTPVHIKPRILATSIDFDNADASLDTALSVAKEFRLTAKRSKEIIQEVSTPINNWRQTAIKYGLTNEECDYMATAFCTDNNKS